MNTSKKKKNSTWKVMTPWGGQTDNTSLLLAGDKYEGRPFGVEVDGKPCNCRFFQIFLRC